MLVECVAVEIESFYCVSRLFSKELRYPQNLLRSERITSIHPVARQALVNQYCPKESRADAMLQDSDKDCLTRLDLGRRRHSTVRIKEKVDYFGLRNFKPCLDQMEDLKLATPNYALQMADALAGHHALGGTD